jgi:Holliday junction resolvase
MKLKESEKDIQKAIIDILRIRGAVVVKFNNVGIYDKNRDTYIKVGKKGVSDILACYLGKFIAIEVKSTGKVPTNAQTDFIMEVKNAGGKATWVDSLEGFMEWMKIL